MTWRLECCLCGQTVGARSLVYVLDDEWLRLNTHAIGRLACSHCVATRAFDCGVDTAGHVPPPQPVGSDHGCDSWHHLPDHGLVKAMVWEYPESAVRQGAREYLEFAVEKRRLPLVLMARANRVLTGEPGLVEEFTVVLDREPTHAEVDALCRSHPRCHIDGRRVSEVTVLSQGSQALTRMLHDLRRLGFDPAPLTLSDRLR